MLKKGTPVTVPAPVIEGVIKTMRVVDETHVEYLVGYMLGKEYVERWYKAEQLLTPTDLSKGISLTAAGIDRSKAKAEQVRDFFAKSVTTLAEVYSVKPEVVAPQLRSAVSTRVRNLVDKHEGA